MTEERESDETWPPRLPRYRPSLSWDAERGIWVLVEWRWLGIDGTTPRNADVWTLNLRLGDRRSIDLWLRVGAHWGFSLWLDTHYLSWHARKRRCRCYDCLVTGGPVRWFRPEEGKSRWWE